MSKRYRKLLSNHLTYKLRKKRKNQDCMDDSHSSDRFPDEEDIILPRDEDNDSQNGHIESEQDPEEIPLFEVWRDNGDHLPDLDDASTIHGDEDDRAVFTDEEGDVGSDAGGEQEVHDEEDFGSYREGEKEENDNYEEEKATGGQGNDSNPDEGVFPHKSSHYQVFKPDVPLAPGLKVTREQSLFMVSAMKRRHNLPICAIPDLLQLIKLHLPPSITYYPTTLHMFDKLICNRTEFANPHNYCDGCKWLLDTELKCSKCGVTYDIKGVRSSLHYFLTFEIREQLQAILTEESIRKYLTKALLDPRDSSCIRDIMDGQLYQRTHKAAFDITCTFNTDGSNVFDSSKKSLWPILIAINELPYRVRKQRIILGGLWFGEKKPDREGMKMYLASIIPILNGLQENPVTWETSQGVEVHSIVHFVLCSVDGPARSVMQGHIQFNGECGCGWCTHPGHSIARGKGKSRVYPRIGCPITLRSNVEYKKKLADGDFTQGAKLISSLHKLKSFDFIWGFSVDYMHNVLLGVVRWFTFLWLEETDKANFPYSISSRKKEISTRLSSVLVPSENNRTVRTLEFMAHWKATEWRAWLFLLPVVLDGILGKEYLIHFTKLADAIHILCREMIQPLDLDRAENLIDDFTLTTEKLYGKGHCTYNLHILNHIPAKVRNWGPLPGSSTFQFESFNGILGKKVHSPNGVLQQISNEVSMDLRLKHICSNLDDSTLSNFFRKLMKQKQNLGEKYAVHNKSAVTEFPVADDIKFRMICKFNKVEKGTSGNINYRSYNSLCRTTQKRVNCIIALSDNVTIGFVEEFYYLQCSCPGACDCTHYAVKAKVVKANVLQNPSYCVWIDKDYHYDLDIIDLQKIQPVKFMKLELEDRIYLIRVPNLYDSD